MTKDFVSKAFAIDISQSKLTAAKGELVIKQEKPSVTVKEVKEFPYNNEGIEELIKFLEGYNEGILEATGVYFYYLHEKLTEKGFKVTVVNPAHLTEILGKKTDKLDAQRLLVAYMTGVIKGSYIPTGEIKELRELTRHRENLVNKITQVKNEIRKTLEIAGYKIEPFDKKGRQLLEKLAKGEELSKEEKEELKEKLGRNLNDAEKLTLKQLVELLKSLENMVKEVEDMIISKIPKPVIELSKIPGIGLITAATIYAEFGDISRFPNSKAARAYAGFAPRTKQSGNSESHSGMIRGNKRLRRGFYLAARSARWLEPFNEFYERLIARGKSVRQATCALAGKLACIVYHVLKDGVYKGIVKKRLRIPKGGEVNVKDFDVGDALDSLSP
ncbi:transposase for insertion sequence element [Sulfurisphaera tokodaii str. 7]|uniref:Transposase for insertion sequence element n=3 Tax=Sulfurisphaera tokodaii TaxID=111955 RepID=Q973P4_SULTO|nr:IS110-like element ISSto4 family transposase [Sulfurisphaera tokodaii]BAB65867.1 transposase for insertion sequence element [Sulfurisphaera tokodaii str. 7]